ncbi:MAG: hypothetical protein NUV83_02325 [Candidatus Wolfebacteria bacterium]|nr:hypothetical protein [Candidatus Wolfebacteria bacterium]
MIAKINFSELIKATTLFVGKSVSWINLNVIHNIGATIKFIGNLIIKLLLLAIDLVKWVMHLF